MTEQFELVAEVEPVHWWFITLRERVASEIRARVPANARVLDAGCGTGRMLSELSEYERTGLDVNPRVLELARRQYPDVKWVEGSVSALPFPDMGFEAVISLDVLYSATVEDDLTAAHELRRVLCPGGIAIINLPAYMWLMSAHDVAANSARRYTARRTQALLYRAGFTIVRTSYRVSTLLPIAAARRLAFRRSRDRTDVGHVPSAVNRVLTAVNRTENRLAYRGIRAPFGLSVFAIATR
jgi:SAM-dependent methyltransferase